MLAMITNNFAANGAMMKGALGSVLPLVVRLSVGILIIRLGMWYLKRLIDQSEWGGRERWGESQGMDSGKRRRYRHFVTAWDERYEGAAFDDEHGVRDVSQAFEQSESRRRRRILDS